jgi:ribulose-5-phosphate 4-epimerase/fuculose-1-phosphate aldolase
MSSEADMREEICRWGRSLFERGLTTGPTGNLSARLEDGAVLATPTNVCLGFLDPARLSKLSAGGALISGDPPTRETPMHFAFYRMRSHARGVVHLHSTYATLLSCSADADESNAIAPITPYSVMRLGRVAIVPYARPGSAELGTFVAERAGVHSAMLLANHGLIVCGNSFEGAAFAAEELEESAKLAVIGRGLPLRHLSAEAVEEL